MSARNVMICCFKLYISVSSAETRVSSARSELDVISDLLAFEVNAPGRARNCTTTRHPPRGCSTGPTIYERIDRGPVNPRQFEADKAVCQAIAAANPGPPQMVDSSPAAPMEAMGRLAQTAALAGQQVAAEEEIFVGCMAQRGYVQQRR
jgi:hypothetical protein